MTFDVLLAAGLRETLLRRNDDAIEFVGLLGGARVGPRWHVTEFAPLPNAATADDAFVVTPWDFAAAEAGMRHRGVAWLGFVHGHGQQAPALSAPDRECLWRRCLQLIVGGGAAATVRAHYGDAAGWRPLRLAVAPPGEGP